MGREGSLNHATGRSAVFSHLLGVRGDCVPAKELWELWKLWVLRDSTGMKILPQCFHEPRFTENRYPLPFGSKKKRPSVDAQGPLIRNIISSRGISYLLGICLASSV